MTPAELHLQVYSAFRDYVKHEDNLINNRLSWNFTIQGFLFTAYAFAFQKTAELWNVLSHRNDKPALDLSRIVHSLADLHAVLLVLASVGMLVSVVIFFSVRAADVAIKALDEKWRERNLQHEAVPGGSGSSGNDPFGLPGLTGGGTPLDTHKRGFKAAQFLPWITVLAWLALAANSVYELLYLARI